MRLSHLLVLALCLLAVFLIPSAEAQTCTDSCPCVDCDQVQAFECRVVPGNLVFVDGAPVANLPCLERVGGDLAIENTNLSIINLWTLREIGGDFLLGFNPELDVLNVPSLAQVGERIVIWGGDDDLQELRFLSLIRVGHSITMLGELNLAILSFPSLNAVGQDLGLGGSLVIVGSSPDEELADQGSIELRSDSLEQVQLQTLVNIAGSVFIADNPNLEEVLVSSVGSVGGFIAVADNPALQRMEWWSLISSGSFIRHSGNSAMTILRFPSLHTVGGNFIIADMPALLLLQVCDVDTIEGALVLEISGPVVFQGFCGLQSVGNVEGTVIDVPQLCCRYWNELVPWVRDTLGGLDNLPGEAVCSEGDCLPGTGCCGVPIPPTPAPTTPAPTTPAPTTPAPTTPAPTTPAPTTPAPTTPAPTPPLEPLVTCPPGFNVTNDFGVCGAIVEFPLPTVENVEEPLIVQTRGYPSGALFPIGCTQIEFAVYDESTGALVGGCELEVCVSDVEDPELTCPADQITYVEGCNRHSARVFFSKPKFFDNCCKGHIKQIRGERSGSRFPLGVTRNVWVGKDKSGNAAFCSQRVEVRPDPECLAN